MDSLARRLRARGADYVIVLDHDGAFCDRTGAALQRRDHRHRAVDPRAGRRDHQRPHPHIVNTTVAGIPVVQAYSSGTGLDVVDLGPEGVEHEVRNVLTDSLAPTPPSAGSSTGDVLRRTDRQPADREDRRDADPQRHGKQQYPLGNLIADAMRVGGKGDVAVMNNGGIRTDLRAGTATYGSLFELQPFGNTLYRITVTGRGVCARISSVSSSRERASLHVSGVLLTYDPHGRAGRSSSQRHAGQRTSARSRRAVSRHPQQLHGRGRRGAGVHARAPSSAEPLSIIDLDALVGYLKNLPQPVRAPTEVRIRATGATR